MLNKLSRFKILFAIIILVIIDQLLKNAVLAFLVIPRRLNTYLSLEIYNNYGIAFGIPVSSNLFYFIVFIFIMLVMIGWKKGILGKWGEEDKGKIFAISFILAGAVGNLIDRLSYGYIVDFINIKGVLVFNLADMFIAGGVLIFLSDYLPEPGFISKSLKKKIYLILFIILGIVLSFLIHAGIEVWYIDLLVSDFGKYGFGLGWRDWYFIHSVLTILLIVLGAMFGFRQGKYWWRVLYEKNNIGNI